MIESVYYLGLSDEAVICVVGQINVFFDAFANKFIKIGGTTQDALLLLGFLLSLLNVPGLHLTPLRSNP